VKSDQGNDRTRLSQHSNAGDPIKCLDSQSKTRYLEGDKAIIAPDATLENYLATIC
jgi:hypothetical protein